MLQNLVLVALLLLGTGGGSYLLGRETERKAAAERHAAEVSVAAAHEKVAMAEASRELRKIQADLAASLRRNQRVRISPSVSAGGAQVGCEGGLSPSDRTALEGKLSRLRLDSLVLAAECDAALTTP